MDCSLCIVSPTRRCVQCQIASLSEAVTINRNHFLRLLALAGEVAELLIEEAATGSGSGYDHDYDSTDDDDDEHPRTLRPFTHLVGMDLMGTGQGMPDCPICTQTFTGIDQVAQTHCKHVFHPHCLDPWTQTHSTCPICRASLLHQPATSLSS